LKNFIKTLVLICFLAVGNFANAQKTTENVFLKVSGKVKTQKLYEVQLVKTKPPKKKPNCLNYKCSNGSKTSFCNDDSDENYVEFQELGYIEKTEIIVLNKFTYNEEFYVFLNKKNCNALTLGGFPLRIEHTNSFIVYNDPSTDQRKTIQILQMENGQLRPSGKIVFPEKIKLQKFLCLTLNEVYILDEKNQVWKTTIKK